MKLLKLFAPIIAMIFLFSCSASEKSVKKEITKDDTIEEFVNEVDLNINKCIGWVDLMPGKTPKFHISGKFALLKNENYDLESTELKYIRIIQSSNELYNIIPKVFEQTLPDKKNITYSTIRGLNINPELKMDLPVDFELIFKNNNEELIYQINDVLIEEVH